MFVQPPSSKVFVSPTVCMPHLGKFSTRQTLKTEKKNTKESALAALFCFPYSNPYYSPPSPPRKNWVNNSKTPKSRKLVGSDEGVMAIYIQGL